MGPNYRYKPIRHFANKDLFLQWWKTAEEAKWQHVYCSSGMNRRYSAVVYWNCPFAKGKGYRCKSRLRVCHSSYGKYVTVELRDVPHDHTRSSTSRKRRDVDSDTDKENADPAVVDVEDSFAVDPAERAEAKRFLKEQERLQERHRNKLLASANVNRSASMLTSGTLDLDAVNASHSARNTTMQLSVGDDVPSRNSWETLSAAAEDNVPADEADRDQEEVQQFAERDLSGRFSVSTFDSGSTRSSFYRDSPSPTRTPVRQDLASAAKLTTPPKRLRFDNDSSDGEPEDPSPASAVSYKTAEEPSSSYETVASTTEFLQRGGPRSRLRIVDYTSSTGAGSCWMESNDYVLVNDSRKRRSTSAGSLVLLGSISQKMRKMGVRQEPSIGSSEPHAVDGSAHQKEGREAGASISVPSLFIVIPGEHDGYTFTKTRLGSGNFGTVSVAVREYAVKKVNGKDPEAVRQCTEGVSLLRRVSHENIIRTKEAFYEVANDMYCVVMDKMEGSVADLIRHNRGYLTDEQTRVILGCTAKGLAYLHKMGFVHRDVKSDNVLVGRNCEVKLADLDSAAAERSLTGTAGTPHWVAPEIARIVCKLSTDPYTAKVDVWSFAIFATEFVLGVPPFFTGEEQPTAEVCGTICNPQYVASVNDQVRRAGLPDFPDVVRLVEFCLKAEPSQRPSMSDILIVMAFLGEPDQQVLLEPIQRMVHRREPEDGQDSNESQ